MRVDADSLGSYLQQERELRHVALQDISAATKIQLKFLEALERDDYDQLPPAPFVAGFLRAYAQYLALDPAGIIAAYHAQHGSSGGVEGQRLVAAYQVKRPRRFGIIGMSIVIVILLGVVGLSFRVLQSRHEARTMEPSAPVVAEVVPTDTVTASVLVDVAPDAQQTPPAVPLPPIPQTPPALLPEVVQDQEVASSSRAEVAMPDVVASVPPVLPSEEEKALVLQVVALQDTWLRVEIDGERRHALLLLSGKDVRWEATERFMLTIGNARGTRVVLNEREISLPPTQSNVVRDFLLTRELLH